MSSKSSKELIGIIEVLGAFTLAGSSIVMCKTLTHTIPPYVVAFLSLVVAMLILIPLQAKYMNELKRITKREFLLMILQACTGIVLTRVLTLYGLRYISAINTGLINSSTPAVMTLFSIFIFKEKPKLLSYTGLVFTVLGMIVINYFSISVSEDKSSILGVILIFGAVISEVLMTVFRKMTRQNISSITNTTVLFIISIIILFPFVMFELHSFDFSIVNTKDITVIFLYGTFGSAFAYLLWGKGVLKVSTIKVGVGLAMIPLSAVVLSTILLKENFTIMHLIGALFCIGGIIIGNIGGN